MGCMYSIRVQVQGATSEAKRSFLERKGLTEDEMNEALRRVPQPAPVRQPAGGHRQ